MKRVFPLIPVIILAVLTLAGCEKKSELAIDPDALAETLLTADGVFDEPLNKVDEQSIYLLIGDDLDGEEILGYFSSGATAEELLIITAAGEQEAESCLSVLQKHLEDRMLMYSSYLPGETYKLENAYLSRQGRYVILCVAADFEAAEEMINAAAK